MKLKEFYSLRTDFTIIGLTGRAGAGCSEIARKLSSESFIDNISPSSKISAPISERLKNNICYNFLRNGQNWEPFTIINYKDVLLFHLIHECNRASPTCEPILIVDEFIKIICQNEVGNAEREAWASRLSRGDEFFINDLKSFLHENIQIFQGEAEFGCNELNICLKEVENQSRLYNFFFGNAFRDFCNEFYKKINVFNTTKRILLTHDLANNLRSTGTVKKDPNISLEYIYTIAETINRLIKSIRRHNLKTKVVIDSLKNSLELMYFKEKYSGFYMVATNKEDKYRRQYVNEKILNHSDLLQNEESQRKKFAKDILTLDDSEYKCGDYKKGQFSSPDIENCIQKSDYHIFIDKTDNHADVPLPYLDLDYQLLRLISLIIQPGIVTPTAIERSMQVAYNAKFNSGCISRQVGAVVTDDSFSIKAIGWNDVPQGQIPCNLRSVTDLVEKNELSLFSEYEKGEFSNFVKSNLPLDYQDNLSGRNCSFCFKSFQNAKEGEKNQVHTRSLHAEENAMMQITKNGGQGLKGGNLFTTASPCELCSKKAFQLGIKNIYYIDPYPGIATEHILKGGITSEANPTLIMFQGAVGRTFHKLYEPFMAYKDEMAILTGIDPQPSVELKLKDIIKDERLRGKLLQKMQGKTEEQKIRFLERSLGISLEKV